MSAPQFSPLVEWRNVYGFLDTPGFVWQLSQLVIIPTLLIVLIRLLKNKSAPVIKERLILGLGLFAIVASRSALARSDFYHINYVWIIAIILLGWLILEFGKSYKYIAIASLIIISAFVKRDSLNSFMEAYLLRMQSYAIPAGQYPRYEGENAKILGYTDFDSNNFNGMIKFLKENSNNDEEIFVLPQAPEIYYLSGRSNATSYDTPVNFFTQHYQNEMLSEIKTAKPKFIVYSPESSPGGINVKDLPILNSFILTNYLVVESFAKYQVLSEKK